MEGDCGLVISGQATKQKAAKDKAKATSMISTLIHVAGVPEEDMISYGFYAGIKASTPHPISR